VPEAFAAYHQLDPGSVALISFFLGLIGGSFSSVLTHHLRQTGSLHGHRSQCPECRHALGPIDLVPLLSFVMLVGRCRYCRTRIPWRYPLLEVGSGLTAALLGYQWGWTGGFAGVAGWCAVTWICSRLPFNWRPWLRSQRGVTLIEVLVACAIISIALVPVLDSMVLGGQAAWASQRRSAVLGLARARLSEAASVANTAVQSGADLSALNGLNGTASKVIDTGNGTSDTYQITTQVLPYPSGAPNPGLREVRVTVSCPDCAGELGLPVKPVTVTTVVR
jgi:prepilin-type N-terminal cleavage/methylation domain-containing protein